MKKICFYTALIFTPILVIGLLFTHQVKAEPYGWSPSVDNSWQGPPRCGDAPPKAPILYQPNHPVLPQPKQKGQVRLQWTKVPEASGYNIYYGLSPNNWIYSVPNLPNTDNYTISFLANKTYYFAVQANNGCAGSPLSNKWAARPNMGGYYVATTTLAAKPVKRVASASSTKVLGKTAVSEPAAVPTVVPQTPEVKGISTQQAPTVKYEPPIVNTRPPVRAIPTPTPKPKGFLDNVLSIIFGN